MMQKYKDKINIKICLDGGVFQKTVNMCMSN